MSRFKVTLENRKEFEDRIGSVAKGAIDEVAKEMNRWAIAAQKHMVESVKAAGNGTVYEKTAPKRTHTASAPGEAPASDLGFLVQNIKIRKAATASDPTAEVESGASYSKYLEFGTRYMDPRPFVRPALIATAPDFLKGAARAISLGMKKGNEGG